LLLLPETQPANPVQPLNAFCEPTCSREVVDDIFACALKKQTGVSLKYM
jgi:hypothetical protein